MEEAEKRQTILLDKKNQSIEQKKLVAQEKEIYQKKVLQQQIEIEENQKKLLIERGSEKQKLLEESHKKREY